MSAPRHRFSARSCLPLGLFLATCGFLLLSTSASAFASTVAGSNLSLSPLAQGHLPITAVGFQADGVSPASVHSGPDLMALLALQQTELTASDPASYDIFGCSVALSGDTALVGALLKSVGGQAGAGAAYVFVRSGTSWSQQAELTDPGAAAKDRFGCSLALSGDTALIGADGTEVGGKYNAGAAYVFVRSGTSWSQQAELTDPGAATNDWFGDSVALSGDLALVGAQGETVIADEGATGAAYVFARSGTSWSQQAELTDPDAAGGEADGADFGCSVALSGDTAVVGADWERVGELIGAGAAFVFTGSGTNWSQQTELAASDAAVDDHFGCSVAFSGDTALVGACQKTVGRNTGVGAAYIFTGSGPSWSQQAELSDPGAAWEDVFGCSVALSGDTALVGAEGETVSGQADAGVACIFTGSGANWSQLLALSGPGAATSEYGYSVALSGDTALVGAVGTTVAGQTAGAAYVVPLSAPVNTSPPTVSGTPVVGDSLSCTTGSWTGNPTPSLTYQWLRDGSAISGAMDNTYTVQSIDQGHGLSCQVTGSNCLGQENMTSNTVQVPFTPPVNTSPPTVSGTPVVGDSLSCTTGSWTGNPTPSLTYQWLRDGSAISGAMDNTYTVQSIDQGHGLSCQVTGSNTVGHQSVTSNSAQVASPPVNTSPPTVRGTPVVGASLWCATGSWTGDPTPAFAYQWLRDGSAISGATQSSYKVKGTDPTHVLSCQITASNIAGRESATSSTVQALVAPSLTLKARPQTLRAGRSITLSGVVKNIVVGDAAVCIWRKVGGKLTVLKHLTITRSGAFRWVKKTTKAGKLVFVASYKAGGVSFRSKAISVTVRK